MADQAKSADVTAPPVFKDADGREWTVNLTVGIIDRVRERLKINLYVDKDDATEVVALLFDDQRLAGLLWFLVKKQAKGMVVAAEEDEPEHAYGEADFRNALDANAMAEGWKAVCDAILFFTRAKNPKLAAAIEKVIEGQMRVVEAGVGQILETMTSPEVERGIQEAAEKIGQEMKANTVRQLANLPSVLQES